MTTDAPGRSSPIVVTDKAWSIERHAIDPIPSTDRHGKPIELLKMWIGANINYIVVVTGSLIYALGLSLAQSLAAIIVGNLLGCSILGLSSIMGPKTGTAAIVTSRTSFGHRGAVLPIFISLLSALSWFSIQSVVATESLEAIFKLWGWTGPSAIGVALLVILVAEIALAILGHATIIAAERWIAVALAVLFAGLVIFVLPHLSSPTVHWHTAAPLSTWLVAVGVIVSFPIGWTNFASDYSRYFPAHEDWRRIALSAGGGQFIALVFCQTVGVLFAVALNGALGSDPINALHAFLPTWYIVPFLVAVILGGIAANVPNGYTAGLGMLALRLPINRITSLLVIAGFTLIVRILTVYYGEFYQVYQGFLEYLVYWTTPWAAIVITDYFLRGGRYDSAAMMQWGHGPYWYRNGCFWPGIIAFVVGVTVSVMCSYSATYESPFAHAVLGNADLSFEAGLTVAAIIYYVMAHRHLYSASSNFVAESIGS